MHKNNFLVNLFLIFSIITVSSLDASTSTRKKIDIGVGIIFTAAGLALEGIALNSAYHGLMRLMYPDLIDKFRPSHYFETAEICAGFGILPLSVGILALRKGLK